MAWSILRSHREVREALCEVKEMLDQIQGYQTFTSLSTRLIVIEKTTHSGVPARKGPGHDSVITFGNLTWSVDMNGKNLNHTNVTRYTVQIIRW